MTIEPGAALLWAREQMAVLHEGCGDKPNQYRAGYHDDRCGELRDLARAFRAGQSHAAGLLAALERISNSTGCVDACPCWAKLRRQASAAIAAAKGAGR